MINKGITDVFFDLDHTLWNFEKNSALTFDKILKLNQVALPLQDFLDVYIPANLAFWKLYREEKITKEALRYQRLKSVFDTLSYRTSDELIHTLSEQYIQYLSSYNHLFPYTIEILTYLQSKYKLHIITNGFEEVQNKKMKNAAIFDFFDQIINSEMAGVKKPNPIIFELALEKANTTAAKSIMIGDSIEADILGAKNLGFKVIHFNAHNDLPHEICPIIHELEEIKNFL